MYDIIKGNQTTTSSSVIVQVNEVEFLIQEAKQEKATPIPVHFFSSLLHLALSIQILFLIK